MRPGFTLIVIVILVSSLLLFLFIVNFVLVNRVMFETKYDIVITLPGWSHTWEGVQFMYIIAGSVLLGALIIAITTLGLDAKRILKLRHLRKELQSLQEALQKAQQSVQAVETKNPEEPLPGVEEVEGPGESPDSGSVTPEEITKSFEDAVEKRNFLEYSKKRREEEQENENLKELDIRARIAEEPVTEDVVTAPELRETQAENSTPVKDQEMSEELPVEAEVVDSGEDSRKKRTSKEMQNQMKEKSLRSEKTCYSEKNSGLPRRLILLH